MDKIIKGILFFTFPILACWILDLTISITSPGSPTLFGLLWTEPIPRLLVGLGAIVLGVYLWRKYRHGAQSE